MPATSNNSVTGTGGFKRIIQMNYIRFSWHNVGTTDSSWYVYIIHRTAIDIGKIDY